MLKLFPALRVCADVTDSGSRNTRHRCADAKLFLKMLKAAIAVGIGRIALIFANILHNVLTSGQQMERPSN